jgi:hypothetical protein
VVLVRFLLDIPAPPMFMAVFAHSTGSGVRYHSIMSTHALDLNPLAAEVEVKPLCPLSVKAGICEGGA